MFLVNVMVSSHDNTQRKAFFVSVADNLCTSVVPFTSTLHGIVHLQTTVLHQTNVNVATQLMPCLLFRATDHNTFPILFSNLLASLKASIFYCYVLLLLPTDQFVFSDQFALENCTLNRPISLHFCSTIFFQW